MFSAPVIGPHSYWPGAARSSISGCTGHNSHREQASLIRRYVIGRNKHLTDAELRKSSDEPERSDGQRMPEAVLPLPSDLTLALAFRPQED